MQPTSIHRYVLTLSLFIFIYFGMGFLVCVKHSGKSADNHEASFISNCKKQYFFTRCERTHFEEPISALRPDTKEISHGNVRTVISHSMCEKDENKQVAEPEQSAVDLKSSGPCL